MKNVKALILCGGKGKRLRPITYYIQKTMIPVGYKQRPLLEYIVRLFRFHNLRDLAFLVNYKAEQIRNFFDDGARFGVKIRYIPDSQLLKGTGGSVINAYKNRFFNEKDTVIVYYGDIITNMNLKELIDFHVGKKAMATLALASGFEVRVGVADLAEGEKIVGFIEKPKLEKPVSVGILVLEGKALKDSMKLAEEKATMDLMGDLIPRLTEAKEPVYGFLSDAFWYDVGSTEAYEKLDKRRIRDTMSFLF